jgi:hypothetical protein
VKTNNFDLLERIKENPFKERNHLLSKTVLIATKEDADGVNDLLVYLLNSY